MAGSAPIDAFVAFCKQRNPRFIHPIPQHTQYEQMLIDLARGDAAVRAAFEWARKTQNASDEAILADWRRYAATERAGIRRAVRVQHRLAAAPEQAAWQKLQAAVGGASAELLEFFQRHDGAELFIDCDDSGNGLFFFPIAEMPGERQPVLERLDGPAMETLEDGRLQVFGRPDWLDSTIVFGGFGYCPERLLLPTQGEHRGSVFLFNHDPLQLLRLHLGFGELLDELRRQPVGLLGSYGGASYQGALLFETSEGPLPGTQALTP
jgi:hypothetical protein